MFKTKYRVVTDSYSGYEVQFKLWWWPFWMQAHGPGGARANTFNNLENAIEYAKELRYRQSTGKKIWNV